MMYKSLAVGLCVLSGIFGWLRGSIDPAEVPAVSEEWVFKADDGSVQNKLLYNTMSAAIMRANMFPYEEDAPEAQVPIYTDPTQDPQSEAYIPPFPDVLSVAMIDGTGHLNLRGVLTGPSETSETGDGKSVIYVKQGDTLDSGWYLKSIDLTQVVAVYKNKEQTFYLQYNETVTKLDDDTLDEISNDIPSPL